MKYALVKDAKVISPYVVDVWFTDGTHRVIDLSPVLWGKMFEPLKDPSYFRQMFIEDGALTWPNGADISPEYLYTAGELIPA